MWPGVVGEAYREALKMAFLLLAGFLVGWSTTSGWNQRFNLQLVTTKFMPDVTKIEADKSPSGFCSSAIAGAPT